MAKICEMRRAALKAFLVITATRRDQQYDRILNQTTKHQGDSECQSLDFSY